MVSPRIFETLPEEERKLWHTHEFEVKSGMLIMPAPAGVPKPVWEAAETAEMQDVAPIYGKTYHFWQVDRGDVVPMGPPQLMGSFTSEENVKIAKPGGLDELLGDRDGKFGVDYRQKAKKREGIESVEKHPGMYINHPCWMDGSFSGGDIRLTNDAYRCRCYVEIRIRKGSMFYAEQEFQMNMNMDMN
jgi:hypothetical protein